MLRLERADSASGSSTHSNTDISHCCTRTSSERDTSVHQKHKTVVTPLFAWARTRRKKWCLWVCCAAGCAGSALSVRVRLTCACGVQAGPPHHKRGKGRASFRCSLKFKKKKKALPHNVARHPRKQASNDQRCIVAKHTCYLYAPKMKMNREGGGTTSKKKKVREKER